MSINREIVKVYDMTCTSCEGRVEKSLRNLEGVKSAKASYVAEQVTIEYDTEFCNINKIKATIKSAGYSVINSNNIKFAGIFIIAAAIILLGSSTSGFDMNAKLNGASYLVLFVVGMLTSIHCVGMCGGIMLTQSVSTHTQSLNSTTQNTSIENTSKLKAILPAILYNAGRVIAYTIIGGIVGAYYLRKYSNRCYIFFTLEVSTLNIISTTQAYKKQLRYPQATPTY